MPKTPVDPNDLGALLSDYERRLHNLETASGLTNASMSDPNGIVRLRLGRLTDTGDYGIEVRNSGGVTVYLANGDGVAYPRQPLVLTKVSDFIVVTSSTFTGTWSMMTPYVTADAVQIQLAVGADAATTGEVRITTNVSGSPISAVLSVPASTAAAYEWKWKVPGMILGTGPITFQIQARRVTGAGNINVYPPTQMHETTAATIGATATGV